MAVVTILIGVGIGLLSAGVNYYIAHRRQQAAIAEIKPEGFDPEQFPMVTESTSIPVVFGTRRVKGPNCLWFGDFGEFQWPNDAWRIDTAQDDEEVGRFRYRANMLLSICLGPVNSIERLWVGELIVDDTARHPASGVSRIKIDKGAIFGGSKSEGGLIGVVTYQNGYPDLATHPYILEQMPNISGACRGIVTCLVGGDIIPDSPWSLSGGSTDGQINPRFFYHGTRPNIRPWSFDVRRTTVRGFGDAQWYTAKADISGDMNPAHIIHEALTDRAWGMGLPQDRLDLDSFTAAADLFHEEGLGLSTIWTQQTSHRQLIQEVLRHSDCIRYIDQPTGKWVLKPIRKEDEEGIVELGPDNVQEILTFSKPSSSERVTTLSLIYRDRDTDKDRTVTVHDQAAISVRGEVVDTVQYPFIGRAAVANEIAIRDLRQMSMPRASVDLVANPGEASNLKPGDIFSLAWPAYGISKIIMRVVSVDTGDEIDSDVRIEAIEDVFRSEATIYDDPGDPQWSDPIAPPANALNRVAFELPLWMRARHEGVAIDTSQWTSLVSDERGRAALFTTQPDSGSSWDLWVDTDGQSPSFAQSVSGWARSFNLSVATSVAEATTLSLSGDDIRLDVGEIVWSSVNEELMLVDAFTEGTPNTITVKRGILDTTPAEVIGLSDDLYVIGRIIEQGGGEDILIPYFGSDQARNTTVAVPREMDLRALISTGAGQLSYTDATPETIDLLYRSVRPYPPGKTTAEQITGSLPSDDYVWIKWAHRNRVAEPFPLQTDDSPFGGPESGVGYNIKIYEEAPTPGLLRDVDLAGSVDDYEYTFVMEDIDRGGDGSGSAGLADRIRIELRSEKAKDPRDTSYYAQVRIIDRT